MPHKKNEVSESLLELESSLSRLGGDRTLFGEFATIFLEDAPPLMQEISEGLDASSADTVERKAHALKGLTSNFGAKPCVKLMLAIEHAARHGELSEAKEAYDELIPLYQQLSLELQQFAR